MSVEPAAGASAPASETVHAFFFVTAEADPGMLTRLLEPFAKLGLTPHRVHASTEAGDGREFTADLRVCEVTGRTAHLVDKALRRIVGVRSVISVTE